MRLATVSTEMLSRGVSRPSPAVTAYFLPLPLMLRLLGLTPLLDAAGLGEERPSGVMLRVRLRPAAAGGGGAPRDGIDGPAAAAAAAALAFWTHAVFAASTCCFRSLVAADTALERSLAAAIPTAPSVDAIPLITSVLMCSRR